MAEQLVCKHRLDNGLTLNIYDASKKIAGDRYQLLLIQRIRIPISAIRLDIEDQDSVDSQNFIKAMGRELLFEKCLEQNFVDKHVKDDKVKAMVDSILSTTAKYYSHVDFPKKYALRRYREHLKNEALPYPVR